jgi:hypothetical protein
MTPMQPFQFDQPALVQSTPNIRPDLPARVKTVLGLKVIGCLLAIGASFLMLLAFNAAADHDVSIPPALAHRMATYAMVATGLSLVELLGVAGVCSSGGVRAPASRCSTSLRMQAHAIVRGDDPRPTMIVGSVIASRWEDLGVGLAA